MTRMTRPDCAVMCNLINTHTHRHTHTHRMTRMTGPDCAVMCNLINTHAHTHRMTRMTGPDCAVMCNVINTHTHAHTHRVGSVAANPDNLGSNKKAGGEYKVLRAQVRFVQAERVCPLCRV